MPELSCHPLCSACLFATDIAADLKVSSERGIGGVVCISRLSTNGIPMRKAARRRSLLFFSSSRERSINCEVPQVNNEKRSDEQNEGEQGRIPSDVNAEKERCYDRCHKDIRIYAQKLFHVFFSEPQHKMFLALLAAKENNPHHEKIDGNIYFGVCFYFLPRFLHFIRPVNVIEDENGIIVCER